MRLLDLYYGAGGAAVGYARAGFEVVGVDIARQPRYPFSFVQGDATAPPLDLSAFDAVHASPPCHDHTYARGRHPIDGTGWQLAHILGWLRGLGLPYVVECTPGNGQPPGWVTLCGSHFGLGVRRHRRFWSSVWLPESQCRHALQPHPVDCTGNGASSSVRLANGRRFIPQATLGVRQEAMQVDWMTKRELAQAVPPAYTEHIGWFLARAVAG